MNWILIPLSFGVVLITLPGVFESGVLSVAAWFCSKQKTGIETEGKSLQLGILIPAHEEEGLIERAVTSLKSSCGDESVTVIAHNCTDRTAERAANAGARVWTLNGPAGKGFALEEGFARLLAEGQDAVLVVDADCVVDSNLVHVVKAALADGADAVQCRYELRPAEKNPRELMRAMAFRAFNHIRAMGREGLGLSAGIYGSGFALSRRALETVRYQAHSGVEDLEYHLELTLNGMRVRYRKDAVVWSEVPFSRTGDRTQQARWDDGRRSVAAKYTEYLPGAIFGGRWSAVEAWMNADSLPLALQMVALALLAGLAAPLQPALRVGLFSYVAAGFVAIALTLLMAAKGYPKLLLWKAAGKVPYFVIMKVLRLPSAILQRRTKNKWVRTERAPQNTKPFPKGK
jgi:cellulose synthase/poly-beta-1,6-N-acetylglucosamine synthase-like glycosyltransferase